MRSRAFLRRPAIAGVVSAVLLSPGGRPSTAGIGREMIWVVGVERREDLMRAMLPGADRKEIRTPWRESLLESCTNGLM